MPLSGVLAVVTIHTQSCCAVPGAHSRGQQLSVIWARVLLVLFGTWVERKKEGAFGNGDWVSSLLFRWAVIVEVDSFSCHSLLALSIADSSVHIN